ncbi:hypothetical protein FT663_05346 [Candidozyma haemuli var. vulneris]|uniref:Bul1 N-terminal domain-containing protein n=1 Tax=Candidozyma haemuli TaxID=45357 RepID=A0A2V1AV09_9ASCO|nr:hypothetical protein CXQ85_000596 [[Candida] haemuloni]KAF3985108.1 hypothetical protein FT662_05352 [[Candida] haemuloni var. vulneris]KAF3985317.1 hypothetical protein FT663_05346 [[Candida] haemuloni var. vulneris]PVH21614.1 hypothetical protein CXQ85_000596 [[Candida] haemuloni]
MREGTQTRTPPSNPPPYEEGPIEIDGNQPSVNPNGSDELVSENSPEKRNIPYRPDKHLQKQINRLMSPTPLMTSPSGTRTEYFDLLPSFQLYQSILKRNDFEFDENALGNPPVYGEIDSRDGQFRTSITTDNRSNNFQNFGELDDENSNQASYLFSEVEANDGYQVDNSRDSSNVSETHDRDGVLSHESYGCSVLDNIDKLPVARSSPLSVQIFVTKDVPVPNKANELENKLKEYSCGDIVNGYIIIANTSNRDVDFGLFTVSLEGAVKAISLPSKQDALSEKYSAKIMLKKFLKMYDLNASYNYGVIPSSAGIQYDPDTRDHHDGCILGLPDNRILKAGERYKKFITFKFPEMLLDSACPHDVMRHTMPPPSFGIENRFHAGQTIEVNKALGYGTVNNRGSPIRLRDFSFDNLSVSYAIEAKFIDKQHAKTQDCPIDANEINNPDPSNESKYVISKKTEFFLRFIPNVKSQIETYSRAYRNFREDTFDELGIDGMFHSQLASTLTWKKINAMRRCIEEEIRSSVNQNEAKRDDVKRKNILFNNKPLNRGGMKEDVPSSVPSSNSNTIISSPTTIYLKRRKRLLNSSVKIGSSRMAVTIPNKLIPYASPRLLQKYNKGSSQTSNDVGQTLCDISTGGVSLQPVSSNMEELYNRDDEILIKSVKAKIYFESYEKSMKPPQLGSIDFNIIAWTYRTEYPIPLTLEHDLFYTDPGSNDISFDGIDDANTHENLRLLKESINDKIDYLRSTGTFVSQGTFSYLKGLSKLGVKKDTIQHFFTPIVSASKPELFNCTWKARELINGNIEWSCELDIPLQIANKNNYTLIPSFQNCLVGRLYALQMVVKYKGGDEGSNQLKIDIPVLVG